MFLLLYVVSVFPGGVNVKKFVMFSNAQHKLLTYDVNWEYPCHDLPPVPESQKQGAL